MKQDHAKLVEHASSTVQVYELTFADLDAATGGKGKAASDLAAACSMYTYAASRLS